MVHVPPPPEPVDRFAFDPVPSRPRRDGWTPAVQSAFIAALAAGESVASACREVGRSPKSAYALRRRAGAVRFCAAWDAAVAETAIIVTGRAIERCMEGTLKPVMYRGRIVGERLVHNDRLLMLMLRRSSPTLLRAYDDPHVELDRALAAMQNDGDGWR